MRLPSSFRTFFLSTTAAAAVLVPTVAATGCSSSQDAGVAREHAALQSEWLPFWAERDCGTFDRKFHTWKTQNQARIDQVEGRWNALSMDTKDALSRELGDLFKPFYKAEVDITVMCGVGPRSLLKRDI